MTNPKSPGLFSHSLAPASYSKFDNSQMVDFLWVSLHHPTIWSHGPLKQPVANNTVQPSNPSETLRGLEPWMQQSHLNNYTHLLGGWPRKGPPIFHLLSVKLYICQTYVGCRSKLTNPMCKIALDGPKTYHFSGCSWFQV